MSWRRYSEAVLQIAPSFTGKTFRATTNARNEAMFKEATDFAHSIRVIEKDLKALLKNIDVHFKNLRCILVSPLPRIYDDGPLGVQPLDEEPRLLGANMEVEGIPKAAEEARKRIQTEVLSPLNEWMNIYKQIMERMKILEALRLELDSRRRTVSNLQGKVERVKATLGSTRHKGEIELKETEDTMARKHDKMENTGQRFLMMERTVYNSLYTLVRDTAVLRDYTHCCLVIIMEAFQSAAKAYDTPPNPATQLSTNNLAAAAAAAAAMAYQPENKYEAQLPAADRPTPKGITGFLDRLRGKASFKAPPSPASLRDAHDHNDQAPYAGYSMAYGPPAQRMPSGYGMGAGLGTQNGSSMRPTHESDIPPPSAYMQQGLSSQPTGNYPPVGGGYTYGPAPTQQQQQQQLASGPSSQYGGAQAATNKYPYQPQLTGGSNYGGGGGGAGPQSNNPSAGARPYAGPHGGNDQLIMQQQQQQQALPPPAMRIHSAMQASGHSRYAGQQQQQQQPPVMAGATGWTTDGY